MSAYTKVGNQSCLGIFSGTAEKINDVRGNEIKANLNEIIHIKKSKLLKNMTGDEKFFFDNTYYLPTEENTSAVVAYTPIF